MKAQNNRNSFVSAVLCALLLSAYCLQAVGASYTFTLYSNDICYSNNVPKAFSGALANAISPKTKDYFFDTVSPQDGMKTFTAIPPKGHMLAWNGPRWVLVNRIMGNNWQNTNLDVLMRNPANICMAYTNVGYSITLDLAELIRTKKITSSCLHIDIAPCFQWLKYNLYYDKNLGSNYIGPESNLTEEYIYTNTVHLTTSTNDWTRTYYTLEGLSLSRDATEATYQFGQTIASAGSRFNATTNGVTLYAVWKPRVITMTLDAGEGTVSSSSFVLTGEDKCPALPDAVREGYTFDGWFIGYNQITQGATIDDMTNITLTARYTINSYEVTFDENYNGGDVFVTNIQYGVEMPVPQEPERSGWSFMGWEPVPDASVPASNAYYRAQWIADVWHDATFAWQNDDGETNVVVSVREGDYAEVPGDVDVNELTGRSFADWDPDPTNMTIISNTVFTAQYTNNIYEVVFDAGYDGGIRVVTNLEFGAEMPSAPQPPTVSREGWSFVSWEPKPESVGTTVPASNVTFTAQWSKDIYYDADFVYYDGSVVVTNNENRVKENNYVTVPDGFNPDARIGYSFTGWDPPDPTNTPITSNTVFTAQYTNNVYDVVFDANGGVGNVTNHLYYASTIEPPTVTREGYSFVAWEPEPDVTVPASNVCYVAQYTNNIYEVVFDAGYDGGIRVVTNLEFGVDVMPQPPDLLPREGFVFNGWIPEPAGTVPPSNVCYVAQWTEEKKPSGELADAADADFELTPGRNLDYQNCWGIYSNANECAKGESCIKVTLPEASKTYFTSITGVVYGVGTLSFKAKASKNLPVVNGKNVYGLHFGYGMKDYGYYIDYDSDNEIIPEIDGSGWRKFSMEIGEKNAYTLVWWDIFNCKNTPEYEIYIDEITWTRAGAKPTEADRPVVLGFTASSGGGFLLSISNASPSFEYVVRTNATLSLDVPWGEMKRVSGDQAGYIELERPADVPSLFYRVGVEAKKQDD